MASEKKETGSAETVQALYDKRDGLLIEVKSGHIENVSAYRKARKQLAQALTIKREKELLDA